MSSGAARTRWGWALCTLLLAVVVLVPARTAGAHAVLVSSDPASDALVDTAPAAIVLRFDEGVEAGADAVRLLDPSGDEVGGVRAEASDTTITAALPELTDDGSYTVNWSAVSADGHPIRGAYLFHLRERTLDQPADAVTGGTPPAATLLRSLGAVVAIAGLVGVFAAWFLQRRARLRWVPVVVGTGLALVGAVVAVGGPLGQAWGLVIDTTSGRMSLVALVVAVIGLAVSLLPRAGAEELAVAAAATVAVAAQGHAVSLPPVVLSAGLTVVHVAAAVAWATALVWLDRRGRTARGPELAASVRRMSPWGIAAVLALALSGGWLVWDRVGWSELATSTYGRLALLKLALLVVAVVLAARNRWRLAPAMDGTEENSTARFRRSVRIEVAILALALVAGAVLAQVRPPEGAGAAPAGGEFEQTLPFGDGTVELTVAPGSRGTNEVHVTALGADGRLMAGVDDLTLALTLPAEGVGPLEPEMIPITTGHATSYAEFPLAGTWTVQVTARPSKFEELRASFTVPIGE